MAPEQVALYALESNVPRSALSMAAQLEYDRLRLAWERGEAMPAWDGEAARLAWEAEHPPTAPGRRDPPLVTRPGQEARPATGEQVRDTTFLITRGGYDAAQVDDLLRGIAAELDAGRPVEPLARNATFRTRRTGYDIDAVDWFLGQFLLRPGLGELAEMSTDPWRGLDAVGGPVHPQRGQ